MGTPSKLGKLCKLLVHEQNFSEHEVIVNMDDSGLVVGDIIEVYLPQDIYSRLLLQVRVINPPPPNRVGSISILTSVAKEFQLPAYSDVCLNVVSKRDVTLDTLELVFKDEFVTRSDMWRLHRSLIDQCVYICKKVSFYDMRVQVNEMWMSGVKVTCGVVGETTKVVYRSQSAKVHIYIQMSVEMWDFDPYGDLYFEKAVMGFLKELFEHWKELVCNHEVMIVLFSRTIYDHVQSIDDFPAEMRKVIIRGSKGQFYQDFYRVFSVIKPSEKPSEKYDGLKEIMVTLKRSFHGYKEAVCGDSKEQKSKKCTGRISRAAEGNLLEAINLSLNVFEKGYIDCGLEETNWATVVVTPSTGVFEVDKDLTLLTKQRLIENGVGVDLVCLAEQPLHAVPLLKFVSSDAYQDGLIEYNVPQWINHSYYTKASTRSSQLFVPRMQVPISFIGKEITLPPKTYVTADTIDYDEFDSEVFDYARAKGKPSTKASVACNRSAVVESSSVQSSPEPQQSLSLAALKKFSFQDEAPIHFLRRSVSDDPGRALTHESFKELQFTIGSEQDDTPQLTSEHVNFQYEAAGVRPGALNPFKPHEMANVITLFRHRWLHAFPQDMKGTALQEHHRTVKEDDEEPKAKSPAPEVEEAALAAVASKSLLNGSDADSVCSSSANSVGKRHGSAQDLDDESDFDRQPPLDTRPDWAATIMTGMDWKSLCIPACLPLTIDYFPEYNTLKEEYVQYHYTMVVEDAPDQGGSLDSVSSGRFDRNTMPANEKFLEMISQRIAQGFQFVVNTGVGRILNIESKDIKSMAFSQDKDYVLSYGLTIQHLKRTGATVSVIRYALRNPVALSPLLYRYRLYPTNACGYLSSSAIFKFEDADKYNWNNLDRYICDTEKECNQLNEYFKYWRCRFVLLPCNRLSMTTDDIDWKGNFDLEVMQQIEGFLRFLEGLNRIKRPQSSRQLFSCRKTDAVLKQRYSSKLSALCASEHSSSASLKSLGEHPKTTPEKERLDNKVVDSRRSPSLASSGEHLEGSKEAIDPSISLTSPFFIPPEHFLSVDSGLPDIVKAMQNKEYGLCFLPAQANLREWTFISAEAVAWMIKTVDGVNTKTDAVNLLQRLLDSKFILHASGSPLQKFMDGFYLYFMQTDKKEGDAEKRRFWQGPKKTEEELLSSYNIQWLEVAVWRESYGFRPVFLDRELPQEFLLRKKKAEGFKQQATGAQENVPPMDSYAPIYKSMEYNLDPEVRKTQKLPSRSEWCTICYHGNYFPYRCAYAIELNWMVTTGCVISEMIKDWQRRAAGQRLRLVPAPMCAFQNSTIRCSANPFRKPAFIPLDLRCLLKGDQVDLFDGFEEKSRSRRMLLFLEAILLKFSFLRDMVQTSPEGSLHTGPRKFYQYIHSSGSVLVQVALPPSYDASRFGNAKDRDIAAASPFRKKKAVVESSASCLKVDTCGGDQFNEQKEQFGFFWVENYVLTKRWTSFAMSRKSQENVVSVKLIVDELADFCANKNNSLVKYWDNCLEQLAHSSEAAVPSGGVEVVLDVISGDAPPKS